MNDLFSTKQKIEDGISSFKTLLDHAGWKLFCQIVDANIEVLKERLENGAENETKADVDRTRDKLKIMREMRNTPENFIKKLESPEVVAPNDDPYHDVESLKKEREAKA